MKKLLTILSFILLLLICLVVMFCSNEKVTGGGGKGGWDTPPIITNILTNASYQGTLKKSGDTWQLKVNPEDRTVSVYSNGVNIALKSNKYEDVYNNYGYEILENFTVYIKPNNESLLFYIHPHSKSIGYISSSGIGLDSGNLHELTDIGGNYSYYFVLETHESEVLAPYESSDTTYSYGDYRKQIDYINSRLFLNEDNSVEIKMNEKTIFKVNNINSDRGNDRGYLKDFNWDEKNKILTITNSNHFTDAYGDIYIYNFNDKTVTISRYDQFKVKGYLVDEKTVTYNVERPSGWYKYMFNHDISSQDILPIDKDIAQKTVLYLYYDCNPTNQNIYLANTLYAEQKPIYGSLHLGLIHINTNKGNNLFDIMLYKLEGYYSATYNKYKDYISIDYKGKKLIYSPGHRNSYKGELTANNYTKTSRDFFRVKEYYNESKSSPPPHKDDFFRSSWW